jgi:hypothetical protein
VKDMTEDKSRGERRAETARDNDDSEVIDSAQAESAEVAPGQGGRSGGNLQRDIAAQAERRSVDDPAARGRRTKSDEMEHGDFSPAPGSATEVVAERKR